MRLVEPTADWKEEHIAYIEEWPDEEKVVPWSLDLRQYESFEEFMEKFPAGKTGGEGWVRNASYYLVNEENRIVAMINLRFGLNDFLRNVGGNVGYGVRPSERKKGYGSKILRESLKICKEEGLDHVLITCDKDNLGSAGVILNNGGVEDSPFVEESGNVKRRFWIDTKN
ncbi:GNAT family N-acetyltransferase [Paenisporosarcina cavernae]|uniref:GNAT family N-acetyltransferase n=1 Tax=Paenisporosarcina cavernae TaxID=2320858 RepID=A0A385YYP6_9BACL|nr:GNAT family N-acetyltransferase [Paenisporosarcina cavernae]AYC30472.1 GNAT family N-acetyltransferase [Paenisporosarcina cavernae]